MSPEDQKQQGKPAAAPAKKVLLREDTAEYLLHLELAEDGLFLVATAAPRKFGVVFADKLEQALASIGMMDKVNPDAVATLIATTSEGKPVDKLVIAAGTPPEPGRDEWLEFFVKATSTAEFMEDEAGHIDFHNLNLFGNIEDGQPVAVLHPRGEGLPGTTVTGEPIPGPLGNKLDFKLGEGVRMEEDTIFATRTGRIVFTENTVSVTDELVIEGDVDFHVGNIRFKGVVTVKGDVLDDFEIIADKGISVIGTVGACRLESKGNITLEGMAGQGKGFIRCGGNLIARYLHEVDARCEGNVVIVTELINSTIRVGGAVRAEKAMIAGGTITALSGIECRILGSRAGIRTKIVAGSHYADLEALAALYERLKAASAKMEKAISVEETAALTAEKQAIQKEVFNLRSHPREGANPKVNVLSRVLDNVCITLGNATEVVNEFNGTFSILENLLEGGLAVYSMTPLEVPAANVINGLTSAKRYTIQ